MALLLHTTATTAALVVLLFGWLATKLARAAANLLRFHKLPLPSPPSPSLVLGHAAALASPCSPLVLAAWARAHGPAFKIRFLFEPTVVVTDPSDAARVMRAPGSAKPEVYRAFDLPGAPPSMFSIAGGPYWKAVRTAIAPCFSAAALKRVSLRRVSMRGAGGREAARGRDTGWWTRGELSTMPQLNSTPHNPTRWPANKHLRNKTTTPTHHHQHQTFPWLQRLCALAADEVATAAAAGRTVDVSDLAARVTSDVVGDMLLAADLGGMRAGGSGGGGAVNGSGGGGKAGQQQQQQERQGDEGGGGDEGEVASAVDYLARVRGYLGAVHRRLNDPLFPLRWESARRTKKVAVVAETGLRGERRVFVCERTPRHQR